MIFLMIHVRYMINEEFLILLIIYLEFCMLLQRWHSLMNTTLHCFTNVRLSEPTRFRYPAH